MCSHELDLLMHLENFCSQGSAIHIVPDSFDVILTDPPYYDAIPYRVM